MTFEMVSKTKSTQVFKMTFYGEKKSWGLHYEARCWGRRSLELLDFWDLKNRLKTRAHYCVAAVFPTSANFTLLYLNGLRCASEPRLEANGGRVLARRLFSANRVTLLRIYSGVFFNTRNHIAMKCFLLRERKLFFKDWPSERLCPFPCERLNDYIDSYPDVSNIHGKISETAVKKHREIRAIPTSCFISHPFSLARNLERSLTSACARGDESGNSGRGVANKLDCDMIDRRSSDGRD